MPSRLFWIALCACACESAATTEAKEATTELPSVVVVRPGREDVKQDLVLPGGLEAFERAALHARISGYLRDVLVDIGDTVNQGQALARIAAPEIEADLAKADADRVAAQARLKRKQAEADLARITHERLAALRESEAAAVPRQEVDVAEARARVAAADVELAEAEVKVAAAALERLRTLVGYATLRAPFPGVIAGRRLHAGALVTGGTSGGVPIVEVARTDRLRLVIDVPEPMVPHVAAGHDVVVTLDAFPGREWKGAVSRVAGALDEKTRAMRAEIDLDNADGTLRPGMYASVHFGVQALAGAVALPARAVRSDEKARYVYVVRDGVLHRRDVVVASEDGKRTLIASGVDGDDPVVVAGSLLIADGQRVRAVEQGR